MSQALRKVGTTVVKGGSKAASTINFTALITEAIDYYKKRQEEETKREEIWAKRDVLVTELNNKKEIVLAYFGHRFEERKSTLEQFYHLLHRAVDTGDDKQLQTALTGILGIIQENPLKDFAEFAKNWEDPNFMIEL